MTMNVAYEIPVLRVGVWPANVDMSSEATFQFSAVVVAAPGSGVDGYAGAAIDVPASGVPILGILQDNPNKNVSGDVWLSGISKAKIGTGNWTIGQLLMTNTDGTLIPATSTNYAVAMALVAGSAGTIGAVYVHNFGKV